MEIIRNIKSLNVFIADVKSQRKSIGFVPTMGALHQGHISLIELSASKNDCSIVSIFVNPTQFNNADDLKNYPRNETDDLQKLSKVSCDAVFIPEVAEMYPEKDTRIFDFEGLDTVMEGRFRPGHFNGVAQIVSKLFDFVRPDNAYFGRKDFQQFAIIAFMLKKYMPDSGINAVACDIIREDDGLAMSSRNALLLQEHRENAPIIYKTLKKYAQNFDSFSVEQIIKNVVDEINNTGNLKVEYFEIFDNDTLKPVEKINKNKTTGCIAVFAGKVRLIDNISF